MRPSRLPALASAGSSRTCGSSHLPEALLPEIGVMPRQHPPPGPDKQGVQRQAEHTGPQCRGKNQGSVPPAGVRVCDERTDPAAVDTAGDDAGADAEDDRDRGRQLDPGDYERASGRQADAPDHIEPPEPECAKRLLRHRVDVADPIDRVEKHRPDGPVDDQGDVHPQPGAEDQGDQRDERDRWDRPQELHHRTRGDAHARHAAKYQAAWHRRGRGRGSRATSGMSAPAGIGRRNSPPARVAMRTPGTLPSTRPHGTATAIVMASPAAHASIVPARSPRNRGLPAKPTARASTVEASGRTDWLIAPLRPSTSASSRKAATPTSPRAHVAERTAQARDGARDSLLIVMPLPHPRRVADLMQADGLPRLAQCTSDAAAPTPCPDRMADRLE